MSEQEQIYPSATKELIEQRKNLAPKPAEAFKAFSQSVFTEGCTPREDQAVDRRSSSLRHAMSVSHCEEGGNVTGRVQLR
jgi:hypothetical protein